ncbi:MAG: HD domain-containing protein [bacterium]
MNLEKALALAVSAHTGQTDKVGEPYILHPLRVMMKMRGKAERIVAALHDVVEDSAITLADLRTAGFSEEIIEAVDGLTRRENESYEDYITRASFNPIARKVKIADLEDNMDLRRLNNLEDADRDRMTRYRKTYRLLTGRDYIAP